MRPIAIIGLACFLSSCTTHRSTESARSTDSAWEKSDVTIAETAPTTNPSAGQVVVTDPREMEKVKLPVVAGGPAVDKRDAKLKPYALFYSAAFPTGLTVSHDGRVFVCYPRWGQPVNFTVGEVTRNGLKPFPDAATNGFYPSEPNKLDPRMHLVSVQSVVFDAKDRLWLLDTGSINLQPVIEGGPKMWGYDLKSGKRIKEITFGAAVTKKTYLNDVRFDLNRGAEGTAYITDSGAGAIIVVDLASGKAWRKLDGHPSVMADKNLTMMVEGQPLKRRPRSGPEQPVLINSDGIALSPDGKTLYYTPLTGHSIYAVSTDFLADRNRTDADAAVRKIADKPSGNDGLICDAQGRLYVSTFEENAIRRFTPPTAGESNGRAAQTAAARGAGAGEIILQDQRLLWPDTFCIQDGKLYVTANQLNRQPDFHQGVNGLREPFAIFEIAIDGQRNPKE
jgi:sugar lactone lactonase YvrE